MFSSKVLFKEKLNSLLKESDEIDYTLLNKIFILSFIFLKERDETVNIDEWKNTFQLFEALGVEKFIDFLSKTSATTIKLPSEEDLKESILIATTFYYRNIERCEWKQIKDKLELPNLNSIKYSSRIQQFENYLQSKLKEVSLT